MLNTTEYIHLNNALIKMVRDYKITANEREELLRKAGLLKLEDGRWKESDTVILTWSNIWNFFKCAIIKTESNFKVNNLNN